MIGFSSLKSSKAVCSYLTLSGFLLQKRKLSWSDPCDAGRAPTKPKPHQQEPGLCHAGAPLVATCLPPSPKKPSTPEEERTDPTGGHCAAGHAFTDRRGFVSRRSWSHGKSHDGRNTELPSCQSPAMQDCSVSSSNSVAPSPLKQQWRTSPSHGDASEGFPQHRGGSWDYISKSGLERESVWAREGGVRPPLSPFLLSITLNYYQKLLCEGLLL